MRTTHSRTASISNAKDSCLVDDASTDNTHDVDCWSWAVLAGSFIIQLTVPSVLSAFGIFVARLVEHNGLLLFTVFWTPVLYVALWSLSEPICRKAVDVESGCGKFIAIIGVLISAGGVSASAFVHITYLRIISFSIVGGLGTSLVSAQMNAVLNCHFTGRNGLVNVVQSAGSAMGQLVMPLAMYGFLIAYGANGAPLMLAGLVLQGVIGAALFLPPVSRRHSKQLNRKPKRKIKKSEDVTVEIGDSEEKGSDSPLMLTQGRSWKNPAKDSLDFDNLMQIDQEYFNPSYSPTSLYRRKNMFGVDILPEIPEECEEDDVIDGSIKKRDSKRRSVISSDKISGSRCVNKKMFLQNKRKGRFRKIFKKEKSKIKIKDTNKENNESENFKVVAVNGDIAFRDIDLEDRNDKYSLSVFDENVPTAETKVSNSNDEPFVSRNGDVYISNSTDGEAATISTAQLLPPVRTPESAVNSMNEEIKPRKVSADIRQSCCSCRLYHGTCQCLHRMSQNCTSCSDSLSHSLRETLRTPHLLSSLLLRFSTKLCPMIFATLAPVAIRTYISDSSFEETVFDMSVFGFSWLCFLVTSPWFVNMASQRRKYLYSTGCIISSAGFYLFAESNSHDQIILNCVIIGIGQGAVLSTGATVVQEALGPWNLARYNSLLDIITAILVLLAATFIGLFLGNSEDTQSCFSFLAVVQVVSGLSWLVRPILARFRDHRNNVASDWSTGEFIATA